MRDTIGSKIHMTLRLINFNEQAIQTEINLHTDIYTKLLPYTDCAILLQLLSNSIISGNPTKTVCTA